ncbi:MAG: hypothetical protein Tp152DCM46671_34 [Prokaryotic dsDNA virus sp.]|nr:MAG: hypothetical protein Tp152DCM46671_34 [Prokaryotic dsDNA virus sp.]|tara:strand:- start:29965 stop:31368 length:1404 start_codon:yes stop_codon:yes gene_type:complete
MKYNPRYNNVLNRKSYLRKGQPSNLEGNNGDSVLCLLSKGVALCYKIDGKWKELGVFKDIDRKLNKMSLNELSITSLQEIGSDTDKFLMSDNGTVKYVTGTNLLTYSGAQPALTFGIANTNAVKIDAADVADDDYARFTANGLEGRTLTQIKSDIGTGNSALVPSAGTSGHFLKHDGTFGQVAYSNLSGTPTIPANYITDDADDIMLGSLNLKKISDDATARSLIFEKNRATSVSAQDDDVVGAVEFKAYNDGGTPALVQVAKIEAKISDVTDNNETGKLTLSVLPTDDFSENNQASVGLTLEGTTSNYGQVNVTIGTSYGTVRHNSYNNIFAGASAFSSGRILLEPSNANDVNDKNTFIMEAYNDADDVFKIEVDVAGATTISTNDDGGATAHLTINPDGDTIFNTDGLVIQDNGDVSTPASGYGTLYVNSDVLYFKNDSGTATNLLAGGGGGSGLNSIVAAMVFG